MTAAIEGNYLFEEYLLFMATFNYRKMNKIAASPKVGIWWLYNGELIVFSERSPTPVTQYSCSSLIHYELWPEVQKKYPELRRKEYTSIPRGRVESTPEGFFLIMSKESGQDTALISRLLSEFNVPRHSYQIKNDEHYEPSDENDIWEAIMSGENEPSEDDDFDFSQFHSFMNEYDEEAA